MVTVPQQTSVMLESEKLIMVFETGKELTGNPSSSGPTGFRLPLRFFWWVPELTGTSAPIYLPRKKAKMILDVSHAIAFLL